jgi:hypothetical protein
VEVWESSCLRPTRSRGLTLLVVVGSRGVRGPQYISSHFVGSIGCNEELGRRSEKRSCPFDDLRNARQRYCEQDYARVEENFPIL